MSWIRQYIILEENERRWNSFIRKMFRNKLTFRQKKRLLYSFRFLSIIFLLLVVKVASKPSLVKIVDQSGRTIDNVSIDVVGGQVREYNATHYIINSNSSYLLKIFLYNVTVYQGTLMSGRNYVVKCSVADMRIRVPSPDITVKVYLIGSGKSWRLLGRREYVLRQVPFGTYKVFIKGSIEKEEIFYFTGGVLDVSQTIRYDNKALVMLFAAFLPSSIYLGYLAVRKHKRRFKARVENQRRLRIRNVQNVVSKKKSDMDKKKRVRKGTLADVLMSLPG